jgi:hypothetical protein
MHFLLYLPGSNRGADPKALAAVGLDSLAQGAEFTASAGPDGGEGQLVTWGTSHRPAKAVYAPDEQEWIQSVPLNGHPAGRYWVGLWRGKYPTPDELLRPDYHKGFGAMLGDGNVWELPRAWELPGDMVRGQSGLYEVVIQRRFHEFFVGVHAWKMRFDAHGAGEATFNWPDLADFVEMALQINYRLPTELVGHLRLLQAGLAEAMFIAAMKIVSIADMGD